MITLGLGLVLQLQANLFWITAGHSEWEVHSELSLPMSCSAQIKHFLFRQGFSVALVSVLELSLVGQAGLELTEIHLPLPPKCWD